MEEMDLFLLWLIFSPQITYFSFSSDNLQHNFGKYTERTAHTKTFPDSSIWFAFVSLDSVSEVSS